MPDTQGKEDLIKRYIEIGLSRGYSKDQVKQKFIGHGYSPDLFDEIYNKYFMPSAKQQITLQKLVKPLKIESAPLPKQKAVSKIGNKKRVVFALIIFALLIVIGIAVWQLPLFTRQCSTKECFFDYANKCFPATYKQEVEGTVFLLESKNCILTKKVFSFGAEPQEVKELLGNKELTCSYEKGKFSPEWTTTLTIGLDSCQGLLKDSLLEFLASTVLQ